MRFGHYQASNQRSYQLLTGRPAAALGVAWRKCGNQDVCCADEQFRRLPETRRLWPTHCKQRINNPAAPARRK